MGEEAVQGNADEAKQQQQTNIKKKKTKAIDLPLTAKVPQMTKAEINVFMEQEVERKCLLF